MQKKMEEDCDLISVLIGTYNRSKLLKRCVNSVFQQTHADVEIIVVNDASTDNTKEVLKELKNKYQERLKYITNSENKGIAYNSNLAFEHSAGKYIALIGDDDYWIDEEKLKKQLTVFKKNYNIGVVGTWWIEKSDREEIRKSPEEPNNWKSRLLSGGGIICGSTPLITRKAWVTVDGFDENLKRGTDSDLIRRIVINDYGAIVIKDFTTIVDVGHGYTRMTPSDSKERLNVVISANWYILKKYFKYYVKNPKAFMTRFLKLFKYYVKYYIK